MVGVVIIAGLPQLPTMQIAMNPAAENGVHLPSGPWASFSRPLQPEGALMPRGIKGEEHEVTGVRCSDTSKDYGTRLWSRTRGPRTPGGHGQTDRQSSASASRGSRHRLQRHYGNECREAHEVRGMMGQELPNPVHLHRRDNIGIMDLLATNADLSSQSQEFFHDGWTVFCHEKATGKIPHVSRKRRHGNSPREVAASSHGRQAFTENLAADPQLSALLIKSGQALSRHPAEGRSRQIGGNQHVCVDKDLVTAPSRHRDPLCEMSYLPRPIPRDRLKISAVAVASY
jgi:hypothetical protein